MAARSIMQFGPADAQPNSGTFPEPGVDGQSRPYLGFAVNESCDFGPAVAPQGLTTPLTLVVTYRMASATANAVEWRAALEAISDGDAVDTDAASSFDTDNDSGDITVPGTAGHIDQASIALTNADSIAAADLFRLRLTRITPAGSSASGDAQVLAVEIRDDGN
jgi:hypothetical protein